MKRTILDRKNYEFTYFFTGGKIASKFNERIELYFDLTCRFSTQGAVRHRVKAKRERKAYQHPFGGPLDVGEALHFIEVHFDNHMRHIDRILAQVK